MPLNVTYNTSEYILTLAGYTFYLFIFFSLLPFLLLSLPLFSLHEPQRPPGMMLWEDKGPEKGHTHPTSKN